MTPELQNWVDSHVNLLDMASSGAVLVIPQELYTSKGGLPVIAKAMVREGGEATLSFCIVETVTRWLLLLILLIWLAAIGRTDEGFVVCSFGLL